MAIKGTLNISSSKMHGTYKERTFDYEIVQIDKFEYTLQPDITEKEKGKIVEKDLKQADRIFFTWKEADGTIQYKWAGGPFQSIKDFLKLIEDYILVYSPLGPGPAIVLT